MATKVKALANGFYDGARRRPGDIFVLRSGHTPGAWMEVIGEAVEPKVEKFKGKKEPAKEPTTLSEVSKSLPTPPGADLA